MSFPSGHRKVSIMTGCPNQVGVCRAARLHESNLFCLFQFVKLLLDMDQNHAMRYYEICIVEIKRTKNILRNIFHYLKALKAFRGFLRTIFPFPSLVCIVVLLFNKWCLHIEQSLSVQMCLLRIYMQKVTFLDWLEVTLFQMSVIFNEEGLKDLMPPCVVQQFVNHNAVLFKVTVMVSFHGW